MSWRVQPPPFSIKTRSFGHLYVTHRQALTMGFRSSFSTPSSVRFRRCALSVVLSTTLSNSDQLMNGMRMDGSIWLMSINIGKCRITIQGNSHYYQSSSVVAGTHYQYCISPFTNWEKQICTSCISPKCHCSSYRSCGINYVIVWRCTGRTSLNKEKLEGRIFSVCTAGN